MLYLIKLHVFLFTGSEKPTLPDDGKLRLYSMRFCPFAQRVHLILNAKGIPYQVININLSEKPEWYTQVNASGKVPALHLVNEPGSPFLSESLIITEYLDEKYPQIPVYPKDPATKALDKLWIDKFSPIQGAVVHVLLGDENTDKALKDITQTLSIFEAELKRRGTTYFNGEKPGILDYAIWPWFERLAAINSVVGDSFSLKEDTYPSLVSNIMAFCKFDISRLSFPFHS